MSRQDVVFRQAWEKCRAELAKLSPPCPLPPEQELAERLGVSRFTVRKIAAQLAAAGLVETTGRSKRLLALPAAADETEAAEPQSVRADRFLLETLTGGRLRPGEVFTEAGLARAGGLTVPVLREALWRFSATGLIRKQTNRGWELTPLDSALIDELYELREMLELRIVNRLLAGGLSAPDRRQLSAFARRHRRLAAGPFTLNEYIALDEKFHQFFYDRIGNRFMRQFHLNARLLINLSMRNRGRTPYDIRIGHAQHERLTAALLAEDAAGARAALREHLVYSREILRQYSGLAAPVSPAQIKEP